MAYDDRPLYSRGEMANPTVKSDSNQAAVKPSPTYWGGNLAKSAAMPSPLAIWYQQQSLRRAKGEANEIDEAEIRAAAKGVKNKWTITVSKSPELFKQLLENKEYDWSAILAVYTSRM